MANGVDAAAVITTGGLSRSRRRSSGAARPAASTVQAAARIAVERGTVAANISSPADESGTGSPHVRARAVLVMSAASGSDAGGQRARLRSTNEATTPDRGSTSGCHCTPRHQRASGISIASTRSSSTDQPEAMTPSPRASTAW